MKDKPLVSVIIPFYNRFDLLEKTLLSVKAQNYGNYEVILIDDCSENKLDIEVYKNLFGKYKVIYESLKKNSGPGVARSKGRELASGAYIAYLDSDDLWEPTFLSSTVEQLESFKNVSMVFTNVLIKNGNKNRKRLNLKAGAYDFYDLIFNHKVYWATGAALWRSSVSLSANWKPIRDHEDYVHDILGLQYNPQIFHISEMLCIVNKNHVLGIKRLNKEMLKSLLLLSKSKILFQTFADKKRKADFLNFVLWRLSKRHYTQKDFLLIFKLYVSLTIWSDSFKTTSLPFVKMLKHKFDC